MTASDGTASVFAIRGARHRRVPLQTGFKFAGRYVVLAGLAPGDTVVTTGKERLTDAAAEIAIAGEQ